MGEVIDSHCHVSARWYEPVDTLLFQMDRCGVARAVLIPLLGASDTGDMRAACARHPDRFIWVGSVDAGAADWQAELARTVDDGAAGLRLRLGWRSPGDDPFALWRAAARAGLRISVVGRAADFSDGALAAIARACPDLPLILEHLGGLARPDVGDRAAALPAICALAAHPNISLKLPGLGQLAPRLPSPDAADPPLQMTGVDATLDALMAAFGAERLMWGSDFPPVAAREGYRNALYWCRDHMARRWPDAGNALFGATAARIWFGTARA